jgi:hypothetical protein
MSAAMARHGGRAGWGAASGAALALVLAACGGTRRETRGAAGPAPAPASGGQAAATAKGTAIPSAAAPAAQAEPEATPDAPFRQTKPEPLASQSPFEAPAPAQRRLRNGARLLVVENHNVPLVAVTVLVAAGSNADPLDRSTPASRSTRSPRRCRRRSSWSPTCSSTRPFGRRTSSGCAG